MVIRITSLPIAVALLFGRGIGRNLSREEARRWQSKHCSSPSSPSRPSGAVFFLGTQITNLFSNIGNNL